MQKRWLSGPRVAALLVVLTAALSTLTLLKFTVVKSQMRKRWLSRPRVAALLVVLTAALSTLTLLKFTAVKSQMRKRWLSRPRVAALLVVLTAALSTLTLLKFTAVKSQMPKRWLSRPRVAALLVVLTAALSTLTLLKFTDQLAQRKPAESDAALSEQQVQDAIRKAEVHNAERLLRVQTVCRQYNLGLYRDTSAPPAFKHPPTPQYSVFYIDLTHKLSYCPVYKAASSTWLYNLCLLGGYTAAQLSEDQRTDQLSTLARRVFPELEYPEAEEALQSSLKLLVVRHPFERLLSAYRDKLENTRVGGEHGTIHFYQRFGARIVAKYRPGGNQTRTQDLLRPGQYVWGETEPAGVEPTFQEFVRYLIDLDLLSYSDDHWIPIYLFCTPCLLKYDIIAKVETLEWDQVYVLRSANVDNLIRPSWQHKTLPANRTASDVARIYFSQLTTVDVRNLYQKYLLDFELFGYEMNDYLKYTSDYNNAL